MISLLSKITKIAVDEFGPYLFSRWTYLGPSRKHLDFECPTFSPTYEN